MVIGLGTVADAALEVRVAVLVTIAALMTVGVYGLVAGIVKLDDAGLQVLRGGPGDGLLRDEQVGEAGGDGDLLAQLGVGHLVGGAGAGGDGLAIGQPLQRLRAVGAFVHRAARPVLQQGLAHQQAVDRVVVNHQKAVRARGCGHRHRVLRCRHGRGHRLQRQPEHKARAHARLAVHLQRAAQQLHQAL